MGENNSKKVARDDILRMTTDVVSAYVGNNVLPPAQLPDVIRSVYGMLDALLDSDGAAGPTAVKPATPIKKSVMPDYVICLEDGKKLKMLKRHLRTTYNLTPDAYRQKWGLPPDYPMVAPNYSAQRSAFAKKIGLGRKPASGGRRRGR
ncbi:MAG: MucR family transcriptional regulator [Reyranellales bacterium]